MAEIVREKVGLRGEESRSYLGGRNSPRLGRPVLEYLRSFRPICQAPSIFVTLRLSRYCSLIFLNRPARNSPSMFTPTLKFGSGLDNRLPATHISSQNSANDDSDQTWFPGWVVGEILCCARSPTPPVTMHSACSSIAIQWFSLLVNATRCRVYCVGSMTCSLPYVFF